MAADTAPAPVTVETAQSAPPSGPPPAINTGTMHRSLVEAFSAPPAVSLSLMTPRPAAQVSGQDATTASTLDTTTSEAHTEGTNAQASSPTDERAPAVNAAAKTPAPASEVPSSKAATTPLPATDTPEQRQKTTLPDEFKGAEWQDRFRADPLLQRQMLSIFGLRDLTADQKALKVAEKIRASDQRIAAQTQQTASLRELRDQDPYAYVERLRLGEEEQAAQARQARQISEMIAVALDVDPNDPDFLNAGAQDGEPHEVGLQRFTDFVLSKSPLAQARLSSAAQSLVATNQQAIDQLKADHQAQIAKLEKQHKEDLEVALTQARAEEAGRVKSPPSQSGRILGNVATNDGIPKDRAAQTRMNRDLLTSGFASR